MTEAEIESLFADIHRHLHRTAPAGTGRPADPAAYWRSHPLLRAREIAMLAALAVSPRRVEDVATLIGRRVEEAQVLLDGLETIGVVERRGCRYCTTAATDAYLAMIDQGS